MKEYNDDIEKQKKDERLEAVDKSNRETEMDAIQDTRKELEDTKYQHMKKKFTELGIGDLFKAGKKKSELINLAVKKLEEIKALEQAGVTEEEVQEKVEETVTEYKFTKQDILDNIKRCQANLRNNIPAQRPILVAKMKQLEKMLEEFED